MTHESTLPQEMHPCVDPDSLVARLRDHGLFNKQERMALFIEAANEIERLWKLQSPAESEPRQQGSRPETPTWERRWPHDQPNGWNLNADEFLALVKSAGGMMWLALGRAKYLELRVDTRDCGFNLYDRDGKPLNPDDVVAAVEKVKKDYGAAIEPEVNSQPESVPDTEIWQLLLENASMNMTQDATERQAQRMLSALSKFNITRKA